MFQTLSLVPCMFNVLVYLFLIDSFVYGFVFCHLVCLILSLHFLVDEFFIYFCYSSRPEHVSIHKVSSGFTQVQRHIPIALIQALVGANNLQQNSNV